MYFREQLKLVFLFATTGLLMLISANRINAQAGMTDTTFLIGSGSSHVVNLIEILPDGKIIVGGDFTSFNSTSVQRIVRLHPDGTHDFSFVSYGLQGGIDGPVRSGRLQSDGKVLIGGLFNNVNGLPRKNLVRLDTSGAVDAGFITGTGANNEVLQISENGNRIILAGFFNNYNGYSAPGLVYLHHNGLVDTSFMLPPSWISIGAAHLLPNGKVYIAGNFTSYNGTPAGRMLRLNNDGSIDTTFNIGSGFSSLVQAMAVQADGRIILGGTFSSVSGVPRNRIARINSDGSIDTTFNPGTGASSNVRTIALQPDGKIIIGGDFVTYNGITVNRIARLLPNGSLDTTYMSFSGTNGTVMTVNVQPDGKALLGGNFSQVQGMPAGRVARLTSDLCIVVTAVQVDTIVPGNIYELTAVHSGANTVYQWVDCDNGYTPIVNATNKSYTPLLPGRYAVIITDPLCSDTSACVEVVLSTIGINSSSPTQRITVFPNPTRHNLVVSSDRPFENADIILRSISGESLLRTEDIHGSEITIDMSALSKGLYILEIRQKESFTTKKIIRL